MFHTRRPCRSSTIIQLAVGLILVTLVLIVVMSQYLSDPNSCVNLLKITQNHVHNRTYLRQQVVTTPEDDVQWGVHKLAVIVPFRDRFEELLQFAPYMKKYLTDKKIRHKIYVINQADNFRFNRGSLINIGVLESEDDCDYIAMHDVDLLPANKDLSYDYPADGPFHVAAPDLHPIYHYKKFVGGILLLTKKDFYHLDGLTNLFWGWGREDDEFYVRMMQAGFKVRRPENIDTGYQTFYHIHDRDKRRRDFAKYANQKEITRKRDHETGISNVKYQVLSRNTLLIDGANVTVINVHLTCDLSKTPFCLVPTKPPKVKRAKQPQKTGPR